MDLNGKNIIITGASSGIGKGLTQALLQNKANVYAVSRSIESTALNHPNLIKKNLDVSKVNEIDALFNDALAKMGSIDMFIANAGFAYYEKLTSLTADHIDTIFNLNTRSVIYSAVKLKEINHDKPFRFIATLSAVSYVSMPGHALYSATKAALRGFFDGFECELTQNDQLVQTIYPVATKTDFFNVANQSRKPWPVQSVDKVVKTTIKGIKNGKRKIYPSKLFRYSFLLTPWFYKLYVKRETKAFHRLMNNQDKSKL